MTTLFRLATAFFVGALIGTSCASLTAALDAPRLALAASTQRACSLHRRPAALRRMRRRVQVLKGCRRAGGGGCLCP